MNKTIITTTLDVPADNVLSGALGELSQVIVIGVDKDGEEYFASSTAFKPELLWRVERFKNWMMSEDA